MSHQYDADEPAEELEHIPWGMLAADMGRPRRISNGALLLAAGAAVVAVLVGVAVFRQPAEVIDLNQVASGTVAPSPDAERSPVGAGDQPPIVVPDDAPVEIVEAGGVTPSPVTAPPAPTLYREADLMAVLPDEEVRLASSTAENFVAGYFTLDGLSTPLTLPADAPAPHISEQSSAWVERLSTTRVEPDGSGGYLVSVVFQIMATGPSGGFLRLPLRAVTVPVAMQPDGDMSVTDLPSPEPTPAEVPVILPDLPADPDVLEQLPDAVRAAAVEAVAWDGATVTVAGAQRRSMSWRVTLEVDTGGAGVFPMVVTVSD